MKARIYVEILLQSGFCYVLNCSIYVVISPLIVVAWSPQYHHHYENNDEQEWP